MALARVVVLVLLGPALAACATTAPAGRGPRATVPVPGLVRTVRRLERGHDRPGALRQLEEARGLRADQPERSWLLVALWSHDCRRAHARTQAWGLPDGDLAFALRALADEDPAAAARHLQAQPLGGEPGWRHLALAHLAARLGDADTALAAAGRALASPRDFVRAEAHLMRCGLRLQEGDLDEARAEARAAGALDPLDGRPLRALAILAERGGDLDLAALHRIETLRLAPDSEHYMRGLADALREDLEPTTWRRLEEVLSTLPRPLPANPELTAVRALLAAYRGDLEGAVTLHHDALRGGALPLPGERELRELLFRLGRYRAGLAWLLRAVPAEVIDDPRNLRRPSWSLLVHAVERAPDDRAPPEARLALAQALVGVGALTESLHVLERLGDLPSTDLARHVTGHLAFERALRTFLEEGYRVALRRDEPPDARTALRAMRALAREHLAADEQAAFDDPELGLREVPVVGSWLDHGTDTTSPVVAHFRRYGRMLVFGQRGGMATEAVVLSLASLTRGQPIRSTGRLYHHDVAIGYDRGVRASLAAEGGELGGACLPDGIWLDLDSARRSEATLRRPLWRDRGWLARVRASGALAADTSDGVYALTDPGCTAARLLLRYVRRRGADPWGSFGTLRAHEFGHMLDLRRHLPVVAGLPATIDLLVRHGFSVTAAESDLERRAQLAACVDAPDPDLALAEMLLALPLTARDAEIHEAGYAMGLRALVLHVASHLDRYPQLDPRRRIVTQLDRLSNDEIRAAARAVLCR